MDDQRKYAYRQLLYWAMLDIRCYCQPRADLSADPAVWRAQYERSRVAGAIADWLHNLANQASRDFEGFTEEGFWRQHAYYCQRFPDGSFDVYRKRFDQYLGNDVDSSESDKLSN